MNFRNDISLDDSATFGRNVIMNNPLISIVTPTFNSEIYLTECIESIRSQTYANYEHIIIDGGSTDSTLSILEKYDGTYNMLWVSEPDEGMYDAILKGFTKANGEILCWLNSDDMFFKGALEIIAKVMSVKGVSWCTGIGSKYDEKGINYGIKRHTTVFYPPFLRRGWYDGRIFGVIQQESTFWTKELWNRVDHNDIKNYKYAGDYRLWYLFAQKEELYTINCVVSGFRKHKNQKSSEIGKYRVEQGSLRKSALFLKKIGILKIIYFINMTFDKKHYLRYEDLN